MGIFVCLAFLWKWIRAEKLRQGISFCLLFRNDILMSWFVFWFHINVNADDVVVVVVNVVAALIVFGFQLGMNPDLKKHFYSDVSSTERPIL